MTWLSLIQAFLSLTANLTAWARERQLLTAGEAQLLAKLYQREADALARAYAARTDAERDLAAGRLPDDGFDRDRPRSTASGKPNQRPP